MKNESVIDIDLVLVSKDTALNADMIEEKIAESIISGDIAISSTVVSEAISTVGTNVTATINIAKSAAVVNATAYIETTFGAKKEITIDNTDLTDESGNSSLHTSEYDDLANAIWFPIKSVALTADAVTNTVTAEAGIGPYIRAKIVTDGTGTVTASDVNIVIKG